MMMTRDGSGSASGYHYHHNHPHPHAATIGRNNRHLWDCPPEYITIGGASERYGGGGGGSGGANGASASKSFRNGTGAGFDSGANATSTTTTTLQGAGAYAPPEAYNEQNQQQRVEAAHVEALMRHVHGVRERQRAVEATAQLSPNATSGNDGSIVQHASSLDHDHDVDFATFWKPRRSGWDVGVGEGWRPR
jgi:hypothetical protein